MRDDRLAYEILSQIYENGAYGSLGLSQRLDEAQNRAFVTKLVYGVLERSTEFDYYIGRLVSKRPETCVEIVLKIGLYCLEYLDSVPDYAAVNNAVTLCGQIGKIHNKGFVNGVLHGFLRKRPELPKDKIERLSVTASVPLWLVKKYCLQYGFETTAAFLNAPVCTQEHFRPNLSRIGAEELEESLRQKGVTYRKSAAGGYFADYDATLKTLYRTGRITVQSLTSMLCCQAAVKGNERSILDLCAAPGGKSVYTAQLCPDARVTACDIHPHRIKLIEDYCSRMGVKNVSPVLQDALDVREDWIGEFDVVLCDVPCSGLGVAAKKPDVYLNASPQKIKSLIKAQERILRNGARYAGVNGTLVYSTCTVTKEENADVVRAFCAETPQWKVQEERQYLPDGEGTDGFYIAVLRKEGGVD